MAAAKPTPTRYAYRRPAATRSSQAVAQPAATAIKNLRLIVTYSHISAMFAPNCLRECGVRGWRVGAAVPEASRKTVG